MEIISLYFSSGGESKKAAEYFAGKLACPCRDLTPELARRNFDYQKRYDIVILSFPVYAQGIPKPLKAVLPQIKAPYYIVNITYGRMSFGNCLKDAGKLLKGQIIGASLIPAKHTYLNASGITLQEITRLDQIIASIPLKQYVEIPEFPRHPLASFFPALRSRIGIKIFKTCECDSCNICALNCPTGSISSGKINNRKCIRCLKCVNVCPKNALRFKMCWSLRYYLRKERDNRFLIFT